MAELLKEKWVQWAALTTTIFAVCAAISAARGGTMSTRTMVTTTKEANAWAYFQAKSIKQHVTDTQRDLLEMQASDPAPAATRALLERKIQAYRDDAARYDEEKAEIQKQAQDLGTAADFYKIHGAAFSVAVMLLQIAIMLNSVGALLRQRLMWLAGIAFGLGGIFYMVQGFVL